MEAAGKKGAETRRQRVALMCLGLACLIVYAVWGAQVAGILHLGGPRTSAEVDRPTFDFGKVTAGSSASHTFAIRNTGKVAITIKKLVSECACTGAVLSQKEIAPRQEAQVQIVLQTAGYLGELERKCWVLFEQEDVRPVTLAVLADIYCPTANFSANRVYFGEVVAGSAATKTVTIMQKEHLDERLTIEGVESSSDAITVDYDNSQGEIRCALDSHAPIGFFDEKIVVRMSGPQGTSNVEIAVAGRVVRRYKLNPERIFLGCFKTSEQPIEKAITITCLKGTIPPDFHPSVDDEKVSLVVNSRNEKSVVCSLAFNAAVQSGFFKGELQINTSASHAGGMETLRVPYAGCCVAP